MPTKVTIEWISVEERLPHDGASVAAAVTGRYPVHDCDECNEPDSISGQEFWLVLPMHFRSWNPVEDTDEIIENCFVDADEVVRLPLGGWSDELVTHWTFLPNLPGTDVPQIIGEGVGPALRAIRRD